MKPNVNVVFSASMWEPTFGPHELDRMHGTINKQRVCILVDDGATHNFLNYKFIKKLKLKEVPSLHKYVVELLMGRDKEVWDTVVQEVELKVQEHTLTLDFQVMKLSRADVILEKEWLHSLGSSLKRSYEHNSISFVSNGTHVLLFGESNIPPAPLICNSKISYLKQVDLKEEIFFCYCLSPEVVSQEQDTMSVSKQCAFSLHQSVVDNELLSPFAEDKLEILLKEYGDVFPLDFLPRLPPTRNVQHGKDVMEGKKSVSKPPYRMSASESQEVECESAVYVARGFIRPSILLWASPILLVKKKDDSMRMCIDYHGLNGIIVKNKYPLPRVDEFSDQLHGARYFSKIDLHSRYDQVPIQIEGTAKMDFRTKFGHYEFLVMPLGLTNGPATFMTHMDSVLRPYLGKNIVVLLDDILIFSKTKEEHIEHLRLEFEKLQAYSL